MPLPIYGQDNTGTFLLMVAMTLLMTLPHFRKSRESNTGSTSFSPFFKKKGERLTQTHLLKGSQLKKNDLACRCLFMVRTTPGLFYLWSP